MMGILLLFIVCANVANLVLVRGVARRGELAARLALGASRGRILRLLTIESIVLALPAALMALLAARALMLRVVQQTSADSSQMFWLDVRTDGWVMAFAILLVAGSALVSGFVPSLRTSRLELASIMKDDLSPRSGSRARMRAVLVAAQAAMSLVLLIGAGLVVRSLESARQSAHEIGIRIAIGANRADVLRRFLSNGLRLGAWGAAAGLVIALVLTRLLTRLLYGVSATDAASYATASAAVLLIVVLASLVPAWRASRTDPIQALRHR